MAGEFFGDRLFEEEVGNSGGGFIEVNGGAERPEFFAIGFELGNVDGSDAFGTFQRSGEVGGKVCDPGDGKRGE